VAGLLAWCAASGTAAIEIDCVRPGDPKMEPPRQRSVMSSRPLPLWIEALAAPEADLRREVAETIVLAQRLKMPDLNTAVPALMQALDAPQQPPAVVAAVAHALIVLEARQAASALASRAAAGNLELAQIVEPALARWNHTPMRQRWLERLADRTARRAALVLAIDALAAVGETAAVPRLTELTMDAGTEPTVRRAAARALGRLQPQGLEDAARRLATDTSAAKTLDRLVAAALVKHHDSAAAQPILEQLALDPEPSVAAIALERMMERDFRQVLPLADRLAANADANVRHWVAKAWVAERTVPAVGRLGRLLDDPHPQVRVYVRRSLLEMTSDAALREAVLDAARTMLAGRQWRGLEQAVLIAVALDRKELAGRLVELLDFERPEVFIAAAWGLRRLAVPDTRTGILRRAERVYAIQAAAQGNADIDQQSCHLAEALSQLHATEALPLLRRYIPKERAIAVEARATAIWALGHLLSGKPDPDVVAALAERIADTTSMMPEAIEVRAMSAVSVGRMRGAAALPTLRKYYLGKPVADRAEYACGWAIHQLTGEPLPVFAQSEFGPRFWFLEPVD
jgi:hypothetical protein